MEAVLHVLGDAVEAAKSLDQTKLADYIRSHPFNTTVGDITFGKDGEGSMPRVGSPYAGSSEEEIGYVTDQPCDSPFRHRGQGS